jgi:ligand-binding sensor domain-containing protein
MHSNLFLKLTCFTVILLHVSLSSCQLYSQQETGVRGIAAKGVAPKLKKTQGSSQHDNVHAMLQDKNGDLWFATTGEGVYRYNAQGFVQYTHNDGLSSNVVYSMIEDASGNIWFGTESGINRWDGKSIVSVPFVFVNQRGSFQLGPSLLGPSEVRNEVWSIMQLKSGSLWFGTTNGLYCYDGRKFTRLLDDVLLVNSENLRLKNIQCMLEDRNGIIWLGSGLGETEGLCRFDGKSITTVKPKIDGWIRHILQDKTGAIWLSTRSQGIWRDNGDGFAKVAIQDAVATNLLQANLGMIEDGKGNLWFGGSEASGTVRTTCGIWRYDGMNFQNFTIKDGLSEYSVFSMFEDSAGHIWIGTRNTGLLRFDGKRFETLSE